MKSTGISIVMAFVLAMGLHYLLFSRIEMHSTLHSAIGMVLFFIILGTSKIFLDRGK
jgi:hypothetical protein